MASPRKPITKERFLLWMLAAIFCFQGVLFAGSTYRCLTMENGEEACSKLGDRYDQTFAVMIATVLALIGSTRHEE